MSYLKALGIFRLVAEQADKKARLSWRGGVAALQSLLGRNELESFFLEQYRPTPIVAPWNGGSGFYDGGAEPLQAIEDSDIVRLESYRRTIGLVRSFVPTAKPKDDDKESLLIRCRAQLDDDIVPWLDVCFVLSENGPRFFPLLGTGGNDGRLDFTSNFMQRLSNVIPFTEKASLPKESRAFLTAALFNDGLASLGRSAIGQFSPGSIGGANGTQGKFEADSRVNPWEFVLMIEGTLLFAGSVTRRMGAHASNRAVFPFSVNSVATGYGSATASEETTDGSRAELWLPLWEEFCTLGEAQYLFAEGRAQLGRRQAKNAVEFALAANLLGINRGIKSFARYGFLKRNGLAYLAAPLGRIDVCSRPQAQLLCDPQVTTWIDRLRQACSDKDNTPSRYQSILRHIDRAVFGFASRSEQDNDAKYLCDVLRALGNAEKTLATGLHFTQEKYIRPLQGLLSQWHEQANESLEFRLAASLAGIKKANDGKLGFTRVFLEEVEVKGNFTNWSPGSTSAVWSSRPLADNLAAVFLRRMMEAFRSGHSGVPLHSSRPARLDDVIQFLNGETDDDKLAELLWGLLGVESPAIESSYVTSELEIPFEFGVPRLLVQGGSFIADQGHWHLAKANFSNATADPEVFHLLARGGVRAVDQCVTRAARRLKSGGLLVTGYRNRRHAGRPMAIVSPVGPSRLLAAMLFPLSDADLDRIADSVLHPPESEV